MECNAVERVGEGGPPMDYLYTVSTVCMYCQILRGI